MICFMAPLRWRYSLKMQGCMLWRSPSAGGSKLIWTDQQSGALLDVLGTTLGPEIDFSSLRVYDAKTISFRDVALPVLTHLVGASFISVRVSVHTFKVTSFAVECGAAVTYVRTYVFCALWVLTAPRCGMSVVAGKPSQADIKSHVHCLLHKHKCSPWLCSIRWAVS